LHQLLFTRRGERVNRPRYGCGVQELVFAGAGREAAAAAEFTIATDIRRHMPDVKLDAVRVTTSEATLFIDVLYTLVASGEELAATFRAPLEGPP
jgi:phage baseplate assembly protein W